MKGTLHGIGVGPGDPGLLTCRAVQVLGQVDTVVVPVSGREKKSTALGIAEKSIRPGCRVIEIDFPMTRNMNRLNDAWAAARDNIREILDRGRDAAFLTLGDPMLYSTFIYLYNDLTAGGYRVCTVPGVSSFTAAAAAAGFPLAFGDEKVAILPGPALAGLEGGALSAFETLVIFKVSGCYDRVVEALKSSGRLESSVLVIECGLPGEKIITDFESVPAGSVPYFSLIISRKEPPFK